MRSASASRVRSITERTADRGHTQAEVRGVSAGLLVLWSDGVVDDSGGPQVVERFGCGRRQQRTSVCDWHADGAVWVHTGEPVLHRSLRAECPVVDAGSPQKVRSRRQRVMMAGSRYR